jgi:hypothetical protein
MLMDELYVDARMMSSFNFNIFLMKRNLIERTAYKPFSSPSESQNKTTQSFVAISGQEKLWAIPDSR